MASPIYMPARGERAAPTFDKTKPRELTRFFNELEYLFNRAAIESDTDKKVQVVRYVDFEVEEIWKTFPEFKDELKTYQDFKEAILKYYPDASGDYVYSLRDVDLLVGERQRLGINNTNDLSDYHLQFLAITSWLIDKKQLGDLEQQRAYIRAFQPTLLVAIINRLQMKFPDHHPNIPHQIHVVYEAAQFVLQGSAIPTQTYSSTFPQHNTTSSISVAKNEPDIKSENFNSLFSEFTKTIERALKENNRRPFTGNNSSPNRSAGCTFCGGECYIRDCKHVDEYIRAGKCRRNHEGRVVLPSSAYVPREIPGNYLKDRIDEWHRRNPNQLAAASLVNMISKSIVYRNPSNPDTFQLSTSDRIAALEAELYNLRARKTSYVPPVRTRAQVARAARIEEDSDAENEAALRADRRPRVEEVEEVPDIVTQPTSAITEPVINSQPIQPSIEPEHPYRNARDAAYSPPSSQNVGAPNKATGPNKKSDPAYKTLPPVHDPAIAVQVYKRSMESPITITQRELLSLAPEIRSQVRDATTTRRIPNNPQNIAQNLLDTEEDDPSDQNITPILPSFTIPSAHRRTPPEGSIVIPDPIENYVRSLRPNEAPDPDRLTVAKESSAVRSIFSLVDCSQKKECILDPGCQIIAMSEDTCHDLGLAYDPRIRLNMQSANGNYDMSLGLARNVPFHIASIALYMQVHVIRSPAYDILLGRPFDILTESVVRNFANEDQTITINDPNTGKKVTIPTLPRSSIRKTQAVFQR